ARGKPFDECRIDYDREVMKRIEPFFQNLSVLAGYMLIAGPELCQKYKMINLHPAAPGGPAGTWQEVVWQLIESRAKSSGVMMHRVTPELDRGPVAGYCTYPITGGLFDRGWKEVDDRGIEEVKRLQGENNYLFRLIRREGLAREFPLIVATIKALAEGSIKVQGDGIVDAAGRVSGGYDLTGEIEAGLLEKPPLQTGEDNT
ncbi:MAG: formyltransferase family protein, partial [Dehalococcoidia bacterium]|nr:formyltransferase family protein [Dehalococcoidia bacterium]